MIAETVQEVEVKTEQEEPAIKVEEQEGPAVVEEGGHDVVTTEETSNVAINYSQSASQLVYHNDGTYIEYAYQDGSKNVGEAAVQVEYIGSADDVGTVEYVTLSGDITTQEGEESRVIGVLRDTTGTLTTGQHYNTIHYV